MAESMVKPLARPCSKKTFALFPRGAFPEVPAISEVLPGYESSAWFGLFGPARMTPDLTRRISDAARQAIAAPDVRRRLDAEGAVPVGNSPEEFSKFVQDEIQRWAKVVKFSGARPE